MLDTHVVLEAFWFDDPRVASLRTALAAGDLAWWASPSMRAELADVLPRLPVRNSGSTREHVLTCFDYWAALREAPAAPARLRCTDLDDQMFIDLALSIGARWLFTRDQALRRLARPMAAHGCVIAPPERYMPR